MMSSVGDQRAGGSPASSAISRAPRPSSLADVLDLILDKGLVIDAYVRVSVAGIEVLTIDARVVVASVDTYLRFAEAVNRLDLRRTEQDGLPALFGGDQQDDVSSNPGAPSRASTKAPRAQQRSRVTAGDGSSRRRLASSDSVAQGEEGSSRADGDEGTGVLERIALRARR